jgi:SAM-dependent methyltransferase
MSDALSAPPCPAPSIGDLLDERYLAASAAACRYVGWLSARVLAECGWHVGGSPPAPARQVGARLGMAAELDFALVWLLVEAEAVGAVRLGTSPAGETCFGPGTPPAPELGERLAVELMERVDRVGSSLPLLDHVAGCYPDYLRGLRSGHAALLKGSALTLWESYFSAANPLYDVHNQLAWTGVCLALARLGRPARVLELGVGTGGGTAALLAGLAAEGAPRIASLTLSDVSPSFAIHTARRLAARAPDGLSLSTRRLDFSRPLLAQGIEPGSFDVLIGVNAVHNGGDLRQTLAALRGALAPDGWLVISESLCPEGGHVHQDFVFNLLPLPRGEGCGSRFFSAATWRRALRDEGWDAELQVNPDGGELALLALARP